MPSGWYVQLSAETEEGIALSNTESLRQSGYPAHIQEADVNGVHYFRVLIGPFPDRSKAKAAAPVAESTGFADGKPFVRKLQ